MIINPKTTKGAELTKVNSYHLCQKINITKITGQQVNDNFTLNFSSYVSNQLFESTVFVSINGN